MREQNDRHSDARAAKATKAADGGAAAAGAMGTAGAARGAGIVEPEGAAASAGVVGSVGGAGGAGGAGTVGATGAAGSVGGAACPQVIWRALAAHTTMTLAYADEDGPQACAVLYATGSSGTVVSGPDSEVSGPDSDSDSESGPGPAPGPGPESASAADSGSDSDSGPALYFVTATTTRHGRALAEPGARVAFTMQRDGQEWSGLTGLQGRGRCRTLTGGERAAGWRIYTERFPFVEASDRLRAALERTTLWELRPDWLRLIDNGQGFGHKEEWQLS